MKRLDYTDPEKQRDSQRKIEELLKMTSAVLQGKDRKLAVVLEEGIKELHRKITRVSK